MTVSANAQLIKGTVTDAVTGEALQGASIISGTQHTYTLHDGSFSLVPGTGKLDVSFTGYESRQLEVAGNLMVIKLQRSVGNLDEVVMTANRTLQKRKEAPLAITSISKQIIEDTKATRLDQLLNKVNGVYMVNLGNEQHQMSIRQPMTTRSLFLYLEDGIPIRTTGLYNHNALLEMNMTAARQIEIVKGPASSIYGAEAIGGAVNVITQGPPAYFQSKISTQINNTGYKRVDVQAGTTFGKFGILVSGYYANRHNGPIGHSDFHKTALTVRGDYNFSEHTKWINDITIVDYYSDMLGALDSIHFKNKDYSTPQTFTYRKVPALRFKSQLFHEWNTNSSSQLSFVYRDNSVQQNPSYRIKNIATDPFHANGEINASDFNTCMIIAQHTQQFNFLHSRIVAGASFDGSPSSYHSNYISILRDQQGYYTDYTTTDSVLSRYTTNIHNIASYFHYEASLFQGLKLTAALRYDYYHYNFVNDLPPSAFTGAPSAKQSFERFSPKAGITYNYKTIGFYVNYSQGFVPPQISELYTGVKVPYLNSQTFSNYETGGWLSLSKGKIYIDWSLYRLTGTNEIISVKNPDGSTENKNAGKTRHAGIEYGILYKPVSELSIRVSAANSRHTFIDYIEKGTSYNGKEMPGGPHFMANAEATYKPPFIPGLRLSSEWQHVGAYYMDNANSKKYGGFDLLNIRTGYSYRSFEIWLNVLNVTDVYYSTYASKSGSTLAYNLGDPREFNVGIGWKFAAKRKSGQ